MNSNRSNINTILGETHEIILAYPKKITPYQLDLSVPELDTKVNNTNFRIAIIDHGDMYCEDNTFGWRFSVCLADTTFKLFYDSGFTAFNYDKSSRGGTKEELAQHASNFIQCLENIQYSLSCIQEQVKDKHFMLDSKQDIKIPFVNNHVLTFTVVNTKDCPINESISKAIAQCERHITNFYKYVNDTLGITKDLINIYLMSPEYLVDDKVHEYAPDANEFYWYDEY